MIFKALGGTRTLIAGSFAVEYTLMGAVAGVIGILLAERPILGGPSLLFRPDGTVQPAVLVVAFLLTVATHAARRLPQHLPHPGRATLGDPASRVKHQDQRSIDSAARISRLPTQPNVEGTIHEYVGPIRSAHPSRSPSGFTCAIDPGFPNAEVIWFGSWPQRKARHHSDLDIAVSVGAAVSLAQMSRLRDAIRTCPPSMKWTLWTFMR